MLLQDRDSFMELHALSGPIASCQPKTRSTPLRIGAPGIVAVPHALRILGGRGFLVQQAGKR